MKVDGIIATIFMWTIALGVMLTVLGIGMGIFSLGLSSILIILGK